METRQTTYAQDWKDIQVDTRKSEVSKADSQEETTLGTSNMIGKPEL